MQNEFSRGGSSFGRNAMSFGAGALGGVAAYSLMRSMSSSYYHGPGYYNPGYGCKRFLWNIKSLLMSHFRW
mgnify:CR=1 FL=1